MPESTVKKLGFFAIVPLASLTIFSSSNLEELREAAKKAGTDLLFSANFEADVALMRLAAENKTPFLIPISALLEQKGFRRAILISRMRFFLKICNKYKVSYVIASNAADEYGLRTPRELIALGEMLGVEHDQAERAVTLATEEILKSKGLV